MSEQSKPQLLILGSGFGAFSLLKAIDLKRYEVTAVSKRNHFLYTPLLPSTAVGTVEFRSIIEPIRKCLPGITFMQGNALGIDSERQEVRCESLDQKQNWNLTYDHLVIAVGAENNTYGVPGVREHACFLKEISDSRAIRQTLIQCLEQACLPQTTPEERSMLLHFVAVGGGPTGVRFAAEIYDLLFADLDKSYPELKGQIRVTLVEAGKTILNAHDAVLREYASAYFKRQHIEVLTDSPVQEVGPNYLILKSGKRIDAGIILWSTGFAPGALVTSLNVAKDRSGRILTTNHLQVIDHPKIHALGDCACPSGQNLPQLAQVAEQQGRYLAKQFNRSASGKRLFPFKWKNLGYSSYIGRQKAVVEYPRKYGNFTGFIAFLLWRSVIFTHLVSTKNKVLVPLDWLRTRIFGRDLSKF